MKQNVLLPFARIASSLSLFGILLCMHMTFTLAHFLPLEAQYVMDAVYIFYFIGIVLGALLCPLFLPLPGKSKPLALSMGIIALLTIVEFVFRLQGIQLWLESAAARSVMAVPEGILTTMSYGLFYLAWLQKPDAAVADRQVNRTGKWCSFVFGAALLGSVLARYYSVPIMEQGIAAADPFKGAAFTFSFIQWAMICMGLSALLGVYLMQAKINGFQTPPESVPLKTNWAIIIRLVGLALVFTVLNGVLNMRFLPVYSNEAIYHPLFPIVAVAVPALGLWAGRYPVNLFVRRLLPTTIVLFILSSGLTLFDEQEWLNVMMSTVIAIVHYTIWVVFTTTVVENYAGGFWFYGLSAVIFSSVGFAFLAPIISPLVPDSPQYRVLFIAIAAIPFILLTFIRPVFPKPPVAVPTKKQPPPRQEPFPTGSGFDEIFREYELSQREIEVAGLLVKEGLGQKEIAERLFIATSTAKVHISKIYQKFGVKTRAEFMTLFVNRE